MDGAPSRWRSVARRVVRIVILIPTLALALYLVVGLAMSTAAGYQRGGVTEAAMNAVVVFLEMGIYLAVPLRAGVVALIVTRPRRPAVRV